jgi:hypothetical protein
MNNPLVIAAAALLLATLVLLDILILVALIRLLSGPAAPRRVLKQAELEEQRDTLRTGERSRIGRMSLD